MIAERVRWSAHALNRALDRHRLMVLTGLTIWLAFLLQMFARAKPFWHDEVYTILTAQLPAAALWRATLDGVDFSPPLNTFLTHWLQAAIGAGPVATRLPAMVGLLTALILLFVTVRRRTNAVCGLIAVLIPCFTPALAYGFEARGYGLTLGLFAVALYSWSEATASRRPMGHWPVMAAALAAGVWAHYYAVLAFVPIVLGEAVRQLVERRFRLAPWVAFGCAGIAVLPLWPLIAVAAGQSATFWTRADPHGVRSTYAYLAGDLGHVPTAAVLFVVVLAATVRRMTVRDTTRRLAAHELAACAACLTIPALAAVLGLFVGAYTERYVVFATIGLAFAAAQLLWWLGPDNGLGETTALIVLAWMFSTFTASTLLRLPEWRDPTDYHPLLTRVLQTTPERIAMSGGVAFLGVWYNLPERARHRVIYLADPEAQLSLKGTDTVDRGYLALARWTAVPVARADEFAPTGDRFLLYSFGGSDWTEQALRSRGARLVERARFIPSGAVLYEVTMTTGLPR